MKLVALKAKPMVPWFDEHTEFSEVGIFNMGDAGVFVLAEYRGDKPWVNEIDPQTILDAHRVKVMTFKVPELVMVGEEFEFSGEYPDDGGHVVMIGHTPVSVTVKGGKFTKTLALPSPGVMSISCSSVSYEPASMIVAM